MMRITKYMAIFAAGVALVTGFSGNVQAAGPYSCSDSTYGGTYSSCSTNNTANQSSTVATATTVLRAASTQTSKLVSGRISSALGGGAGGVQVSSNGFSASTGMAGGDMGGKAGVWVSGTWTSVEDDNTATRFDGHTLTGLVGADYQVTPKVVLGLSVGYENVDIDTEFNGFNGQDGNIDGDGYTIAPYVGVHLTETATADLTVGYSDISYDTRRFDPNTGNAITGSTDADRYFVNAGVNGTHALRGNWRLKSRASIFYASEDKDAFVETESTGTTINVAEEETELGQLLADARLGYVMQGVEPYALVGLEYDYTKDDAPVAAGQTQSDDDFGAKFGAGVNLNLAPNVTGGIEAHTVEFREDYSEYAVTGGLRVQF